MNYSWTIIVALFIGCLLQAPSVVSASSGDCESIDRLDQLLESSVEGLEIYKATLDSTSSDEWLKEDIDMYLGYALSVAYCAYYIELIENGWEHPASFDGSEYSEYEDVWPGNPFNEWKPIAIVDRVEKFLPGDIVLQISPEAAASFEGRRVSFEMCILGATPAWSTDVPKAVAGNESWSAPPKGALYVVGIHVESASQRAARLERMREMLEVE